MALARTARVLPSACRATVTVSPLVVQPQQPPAGADEVVGVGLRWKPRKSAPSRPSSSRVRHGSWANSSTGGKGMWLNQPIRTSGRSSRTIAGTSCSW